MTPPRGSARILPALLLIAATGLPTASEAGEAEAVSPAYGGLVVVLNPTSADAFVKFTEKPTSLVHGLVRDSATVASLTRRLLEDGQTGRVTVGSWDGARIPFVSDTVNVVITEGTDITDDMRREAARPSWRCRLHSRPPGNANLAERFPRRLWRAERCMWRRSSDIR